uniref:NADH dehydrogenase subunit 4L n=1 Tax=Tropilaelaps mercedesae TaxID=418985 RepID=UPI0028D271C4|nr:NADH dehydrogenase subunit 4L [Tropilaelaps mercedesae]WMV02020.1 NADH dehydrogenase subunit 4L [Tropilaelaps mercedesae]
MVIFSFFIFMLGFMSFIWNRKHLLMMLLSLEMMMLSIYLMMMVIVVNEFYEMIILYLIMVICEACMGMSLMIGIVYYYGSDLLSSLKIFNS